MQQEKPPSAEHKIAFIPLVLITTALFMTLRNMPMMAETGMQMVLLNAITVFAFLIPTALISAELATGWPQNGVFHWVEAAFGTPIGFVAVFLQWIQSIFGVTSIVAYATATLTYAFDPELGSNRYYITFSVLAVSLAATLINFRGTETSEKISGYAVSVGVFFPSALLILFGIYYLISGEPIALNTSTTVTNWVPSLSDTTSLVFFMSFVFGFVGIEVSACHANEVENPQKNYPRAIFTAAIAGFVITLAGGLAVSLILEKGNISNINGALQAFSAYLNAYGLSILTPFIALLVAVGAAGQVSTWIVGPVKGMWAAGRKGLLSARFAKANKNNVPTALLILQASLISLIALSFILFEDVNLVFLVLTSTAVLLYSLMYLLMFIAAIRLRYTHPHIPRPYRVPGGNWGIWLLGIIGMLTAISCFAIGFIPPPALPFSLESFEGLMVVAVVLALLIPLSIWFLRRKQILHSPKSKGQE
ncbi:amino acid/polyamine/organocation transporter, APC superfamily (TC 2.A.3) [Pseudovibrio ascidiaceicola]|uniref:Amino acid/polyamine/organocation transporter, APC superfamily (TC 2.A.3) n=1 Tax=Pseudovibrio ascidiaceicola TaxID=285279 RepID=A0A1I4A8L8_9HYPH|nr:amino acid permease [Pseudovibrio ascidiaceicola]SFK52530.1 amino acid/polyamine/organocation transporter, APC superfamily (TC 2.A.3) [Pseudovibrio ascidiaceicola]